MDYTTEEDIFALIEEDIITPIEEGIPASVEEEIEKLRQEFETKKTRIQEEDGEKSQLESQLTELQQDQAWAVMSLNHTEDIQQLKREKDKMEIQNLKVAIENVRLQERVDELERSAILADLKAKIIGEQSRLRWDKAEYDLHCMYRGLLVKAVQ